MMKRKALHLIASVVMLFSHSWARQSPEGRVGRLITVETHSEKSGGQIPSIVPVSEVKRPKVALVLSGGGARGISAIGVFKSLEKNKIPIDFIVGTSIGSIIGGLYAVGYSTDQLVRVVDSTRWDEVLSFTEDSRRSEMFMDQKIVKERSVLVLRFKGFEPIIPSSFSTGQRLTHYLNILTLQGLYHPDPSFDNLKTHFRAVTTDLVSGRRIVIDRGDLTEAMRASITVPLLFSTVPKDTLQLLDGGLVSNIPVDVAKHWGADIIVAVDLTSPLRPADKLNAPWEVADQIMGIMMQESNRRALEQADVVIKPPLGNHLSTDFTNLQEIIKRGEEQADSLMPELLKKYEAFLTQKSDRGIEFRNPRFVSSLPVPQELERFAKRTSVTEDELRHSLQTVYQNGQYESVALAVREEAESTIFDFQAVPNPVLTSVEFTGNKDVSTDSLASVVHPFLGKRINSEESRRVLELVLELYRLRGFSLASIRGVEFNRESGHARITIDEGIIYKMEIEGTRETKDYVIWRELPFRENEAFQIAKIERGIRNLYGTGLFEQVSVNTAREGDHNIVRIKVRERSTDLIRIGLRIDNERNVQPSIDLRDENFLGIGAEVGLRLYEGSRNRGVIGEFKATRIFDTYLTANLRMYSTLHDIHVYDFEFQQVGDPKNWNRVRVGEYRQIKEGGSLTFGTQLERLGSVTVEGRLENHNVYNIFSQPIQNQSYKISSVRFGTRVDTQNKFPFPTEGLLMNFSYETALVKVTDAVGFTKMYFEYENYQSLFPGHVLRPKVVVGVADNTTPISEFFSLGGQQNFFGVREDDARGRQLIIGSLEYIYHSPFKIFFDTYIKARYDLGAVWATAEQIRFVDLLHGIGLGVAFDTPIGPAEFSIGRSFFFRKDILENPVSLGPFVAYFSIGYPL